MTGIWARFVFWMYRHGWIDEIQIVGEDDDEC